MSTPPTPLKKNVRNASKSHLFCWLPSSPSYFPSLFFHSVLSYSTLPLLLLPLHLFSNKWPSLSRPHPSPRTHPIQGAKVPEVRLFTFPMQSKEPLTRRIRCPWRDAVTARHSCLSGLLHPGACVLTKPGVSESFQVHRPGPNSKSKESRGWREAGVRETHNYYCN